MRVLRLGMERCDMKRKQYEYKCEKRRDQLAGFWIFTFLNVSIFFLISIIEYRAHALEAITLWPIEIVDSGIVLPWAINIIVLFVGLVLRPQFALGYLVALAGWVFISILYIPSCYVTCLVLGDGGSDTFVYCFFGGYMALWLGLAAWRSIILYKRDCTKPNWKKDLQEGEAGHEG